jgi:O-antigen polymerase
VESTICFLQYLKVIDSLNRVFPVTGSWENPNVTAMFVAMAIPSVFILYIENKKHLHRLANFLLFLFIIILLILKCRTAFIGSMAGILVILNYRYRLFQKAKEKSNRSAVVIIAVILFAFLVPAINYAYRTKKNSADGRKLVWKISAKMVLKKPLWGYGYGFFERNYNLSQSTYFEDGNGSPSEMYNAGFVKMGYNEFIQNTVEGGLK